MTDSPHAARRTFVLDTSVLLAAGPAALHAFQEHEVVLPLVVVTELEGKRDDPEVGWVARAVLHELEKLRVTAAHAGTTLGDGVQVTDDGGTVRVEVNHVDQSRLPDALRWAKTHDMRILAVAHGLADEARNQAKHNHEPDAGDPEGDKAFTAIVLVSRDLPMRLLAGGVLGLTAEDYLHDKAPDDGYTGMLEHPVTQDLIDRLHADKTAVVGLDPDDPAPVNTGLVLRTGLSGSSLVIVDSETSRPPAGSRPVNVRLVPTDRQAFGLRPEGSQQRVALDHLLNDDIGVVSLGGAAGTGKSVLALAAGLDQVLEQRRYKRVIVFRPMYAVGGQDLGYLPGSEAEKMAPWSQAVVDALSTLAEQSTVEEIVGRGQLEVLPLTHIRGRSLHESYVVVDEAQSLERAVLLTALTRVGQASKIVLTHDVAQRDNLHVGRHDGIATVVDRLKGEPLFAHVTLTQSRRSAVAAMATRLLDRI